MRCKNAGKQCPSGTLVRSFKMWEHGPYSLSKGKDFNEILLNRMKRVSKLNENDFLGIFQLVSTSANTFQGLGYKKRTFEQE